jgi:hypothetical protein
MMTGPTTKIRDPAFERTNLQRIRSVRNPRQKRYSDGATHNELSNTDFYKAKFTLATSRFSPFAS